MLSYNYTLERFTFVPCDDAEHGFASIYSEALEQQEHALNVAISSWMEALCQHEVGRDMIFAPQHIYYSVRQCDVRGNWKHSQWMALFYLTEAFSKEYGGSITPDFGLEVLETLDHRGDLVVRSLMLLAPDPLDCETENIFYERAVVAAKAHLSGRDAIQSFSPRT